MKTAARILLALVILGGLGLIFARPGSPPAIEAPADVVYVTRTGTKFHRAGCRYLRSSAIPVSRDAARLTRQPCKVCKP